MRNSVALFVFLGAWCLGPAALAEEGAQPAKPEPASEAAAPKTDPAAEKALDEIVAAWGRLRSVSAGIEATTTMPGPGGGALSVVGAGTFEFLKKGESGLSRIELAVKPAGATSDVTLADMVCVFDGKEGVAQIQMFGQTKVMKLAAEDDDNSKPSGHLMVDLLKGHFALRLLPDANVDGQDTYEIEATPLFEVPLEMAFKSIRTWFAKDSGAPLKLEVVDAADVTQLTARLKNVQLNPEISEDRFVPPSDATAAPADATPEETPAGTSAP
jgi:hypothetical protein